MTAKALSDIRRKLRILNYAKEIGYILKACASHGISRETYYQWKRAYEKDGEQVLVNSKPCPYNLTIRVSEETKKFIIYLRQNYNLGPFTFEAKSSMSLLILESVIRAYI